MPLPATVRVRISSEAAGAITMTPVVSEILPLRELVQVILSTSGKDSPRVREVLACGAVVQSASRFRWDPIAVEAAELETLLATFPDPDPSRPFRAARCQGVRIRSGRHVIELPKEIACRRRLFRRRSFWDVLMELAEGSLLEYVDYSYRTKSDEYRLRLTPVAVERVQRSAGLLRYSGLAGQLWTYPPESIDFSAGHP